MMRPVEIIGGGLAGLALGVGLQRAGVPVTVREAGAYPRHRTCGEFINGLRPATAARLGLTDLLRHPALGDADAVLPPYSGQGMALVPASAAAALTPLAGWSRGGLPWPAVVSEIQRRHTRLFARRLRRALCLHPFLLDPVGSSLTAFLQRCGLVPLRPLSALLH